MPRGGHSWWSGAPPHVFAWGRSSAGRASGLQPEGQGFESPRLHQVQPGLTGCMASTFPIETWQSLAPGRAGGLVTIAEGSHPFPSRTRSLSPPAPTILQGQPCGTIGRRRPSRPRQSSGKRVRTELTARHITLWRASSCVQALRALRRPSHGDPPSSRRYTWLWLVDRR
jgi:hypothetical protein